MKIMKKYLFLASILGSISGGLMAQEAAQIAKIQLTSPAFLAGSAIPSQYTCDGANISPPLAWSTAPAHARSLALIVDDPDARANTWVHWVLFNIPTGLTKWDENIPKTPKLPNGAVQGTNDFGDVGYGGPCPPKGTHHYFFHLFALDKQLDLPSAATKQDVMNAIQGHVLAEGEMVATYARK
jgi:Raf kinase inhibitor-like YbhB/YbcL family protein